MNTQRYVRTVIDGEQIKVDFGNIFRFVNQSKYKGKPERGLEPGVKVILMITEDHSERRIDKETGQERESAVYETFEVTIPNKAYPLPIKKGDYVSLGEFMPEVSYYIDYNLILRYCDITKVQPKGAVNNVSGQKQ